MIGGIIYILIAMLSGLCTFTLAEHWGVPTPEDLPTRFQLHPRWNKRLGPDLRADCDHILSGWPRSGILEPFISPRVVYSGACAIGMYMQHPRPGSYMVTHERWEKVLWTTMVAVKLNVGTVRAGWVIDFPSGVQVCFFFNIHVIEAYDIRRSLEWNVDQSPFFLSMDHPYPDVVPAIQPSELLADIRNRIIAQGWAPHLAVVAAPDIPILADKWGPRPVIADCEAAISHLGIESWFIGQTGITLDAPMIEEDGDCALGIYLMRPVDPATRDIRPLARVPPLDYDIVQQATGLLRLVEVLPEGGGYLDLQNGLELCMYNRRALDPMNVCERITKMRLRDCLDNRARAYAKAQAQAQATATTSAAVR
ncbi:hypothetical protein MMC13_001677 [Lambiella insularis]|nr:hypothetical protein [Lambiella insularis]